MRRFSKSLSALFSGRVVARTEIHYRLDLRTAHAVNSDRHAHDSCQGEVILLRYFREIPRAELALLNCSFTHEIDGDTSCVLAFHRNVPVGCLLLNNRGTARFRFPFSQDIEFGNRHAYAFGLFVAPEWRRMGVARRIYVELFDLLKDEFDYLDIAIDPANTVSRELADKVGFSGMEKLVLCRICGINIVLRLNSRIKSAVYEAVVTTIKRCGAPLLS